MPTESPRLPHYLRFARAIALVSVTLPAPVIAAECLIGCAGGPGTTTDPAPAEGVRQGGGISPAPGVAPGPVVGPTTGTQPAPGVKICPDCDGSADAHASDASDAGDSGGPSRGLPELPPSWRRTRSEEKIA